MQIRNSLNRYGAVAQFLHWLIVVLVVLQFASALTADGMPFGVAKALLLIRHKSTRTVRRRQDAMPSRDLIARGRFAVALPQRSAVHSRRSAAGSAESSRGCSE